MFKDQIKALVIRESNRFSTSKPVRTRISEPICLRGLLTEPFPITSNSDYGIRDQSETEPFSPQWLLLRENLPQPLGSSVRNIACSADGTKWRPYLPGPCRSPLYVNIPNKNAPLLFAFISKENIHAKYCSFNSFNVTYIRYPTLD